MALNIKATDESALIFMADNCNTLCGRDAFLANKMPPSFIEVLVVFQTFEHDIALQGTIKAINRICIQV